MACPEMGKLYGAMTTDMGQKLSGYYVSLQSRYGDPRIYAAQQEQMARDKVAVQHAKSQKTAQLLEDAYQRQSERNRELHATRLSNRAGRKSTAHPESKAPSKRQTAQQPASEQPPSHQATASESA